MASFIDRVTVHVAGGNGGDGCTSIRREKFKPLAGPDGGGGGNGGDVVLVVDPAVTTLLDIQYRSHRKAESGGMGMGDYRSGTNGSDEVISVPSGTVVKNAAGDVLADLVAPGERFVLAAGGRGGLGNFALASSKRRAPGFHLLGEPGEQLDAVLELKTIADVALVGFPSAGKSSLIAALSAARPKIADYPFTTLAPNLGVVQAGEHRYTVADVPGLIPGAASGKGLGLDFLRHVERCVAIAHVVDAASLETDRSPLADIAAIETELAAYQGDLAVGKPLSERKRIIIINKIDLADGATMAELVRDDVKALGLPVFEVSAVTHEGMKALSFGLAEIVAAQRVDAAQEVPVRTVLRPVRGPEFTIERKRGSDGEFFQVCGSKPERWVKQTLFANDEAVGYLADRLARLGVEDGLVEAGAQPGSQVVIGVDGVVFDWEPTLATGAELLGGRRGTDPRLTAGGRRTSNQRRQEYEQLRRARDEARAELWQEREAGIWTDDE